MYNVSEWSWFLQFQNEASSYAIENRSNEYAKYLFVKFIIKFVKETTTLIFAKRLYFYNFVCSKDKPTDNTLIFWKNYLKIKNINLSLPTKKIIKNIYTIHKSIFFFLIQ